MLSVDLKPKCCKGKLESQVSPGKFEPYYHFALNNDFHQLLIKYFCFLLHEERKVQSLKY